MGFRLHLRMLKFRKLFCFSFYLDFFQSRNTIVFLKFYTFISLLQKQFHKLRNYLENKEGKNHPSHLYSVLMYLFHSFLFTILSCSQNYSAYVFIFLYKCEEGNGKNVIAFFKFWKGYHMEQMTVCPVMMKVPVKRSRIMSVLGKTFFFSVLHLKGMQNGGQSGFTRRHLSSVENTQF